MYNDSSRRGRGRKARHLERVQNGVSLAGCDLRGIFEARRIRRARKFLKLDENSSSVKRHVCREQFVRGRAKLAADSALECEFRTRALKELVE